MRQHLNYSWKFIDSFKEEYLKKLPSDMKVVNIPHNGCDVPYNYFDEKIYQKVYTYVKEFNIEENIIDKALILEFEAFMLKAKIYLNDNYLGEFVSGYTPVKIDISEQAKQKGNKLVVVLDSNEDGNYPPFGFAVDYLTFSGIYREVHLDVLPKTYLKDIYVFGNAKGELSISHTLVGKSSPHTISYSLFYKEKEVMRFNSPQVKVENPHLWDLDNPNIYELRITLDSTDGVQEETVRFGFRDLIVKKDGVYLNGKRIKLIGLNRHQSYPIMGYAASKSLQRDDAELLKYKCGVNVVRTSHYPQSHHFLDRCDEIGLLVINEIPGWQHIGKEEIWRNKFLQNVEEMVITQRNHPSLLLHGVRIDESIDDHELYLKANEIAHKLDPHRQTIGVRNVQNSELLEDVYGYNDFINDDLKTVGLQNPKKTKTNGQPLLVTEYMGHMDPTKSTSEFEDKKDHALRHLRVINDNLKYDNLVGAIGWCFADYHTHADFGSGDHICPHGVMDIYRNPKLACASYASQQDNYPVMEVLNNLKPGDNIGAIFSDLYVATNCDYIELYKNGDFVSKFYPSFKDKRFKNLKHPPILVDDIVGETFKEERFNQKEWKRMAKGLSIAGLYGLNGLPLSFKLFLARMMLKYHMNYDTLLSYWLKHVGTWGGIAKTYTFKGYKDSKHVITREVGPQTKFDLEVSTNKDELINEETYDTLRVSLRYVDEHHTVCDYANKIIEVKVSGSLELVGPTHQSLVGGQLSLYFRSKQEKGKGKISISLEDITKEIEILVK